MTCVRASAAVLALAALLAGCGGDGDRDPTIVADRADGADAAVALEWVRVPDPPIPGRTRAVGAWTGDEVLVLGGDRFSCPPVAGCAAPTEPPLRDGAALDLAAGEWRTISAAPVGFHSAETAVVGGDVFVLARTDYATGTALLRYDVDADAWMTIERPVSDLDGWYRLVAAGDLVVLYLGSEETGAFGDHVFDPATGTWAPLAPDPLTRAFDRSMVWAGGRLYLFDKEHVRQPGSEEPSVVRAARLDLATGRWERLPDSEIIGGGAGWFVDGERLINPLLGGADGGEENGWGRMYPKGGILDIATTTWTALPGADTDADTVPSAGAFNDAGALYLDAGGEVLDASRDAWVTMPDLRDGLLLTTAGRTALAMSDGAYWRWTP